MLCNHSHKLSGTSFRCHFLELADSGKLHKPFEGCFQEGQATRKERQHL